MSTAEHLRALVEPLVADLGLELYDLELSGGVLRVTVDQSGGVGMDAITALTKAVSRALDDDDPIASRFTLEVSSPGLERTLRTPAHYAAAIGSTVNVKARPGHEPRRVTGTLVAADEHSIEVRPDGGSDETSVTFALDDIERVRTVFAWGATPKPSPSKANRSRSSRSAPSAVPQEKVDAP